MNGFKAITMGMTIVSLILSGLGIGYLVDNHFNTRPVGIIVGILLGVGSALLYIFRLGRDQNVG